MQAEIGLAREDGELRRQPAPMRAIGHRARRGQLAAPEKIEDRAADALGHGEIIGAQDEAPRHRVLSLVDRAPRYSAMPSRCKRAP